MLVRNYTPFPNFLFDSQDQLDRGILVSVLRGTFDMVSDGPIKPAQTQEPVVLSPVYQGKSGESGLRMETDLVWFKPKSDIQLVGKARAPGGKSRLSWEASLQVGSLKKTVRVHGPRHWAFNPLTGWTLSLPSPASEVILDYASAYGGTVQEGKHLENDPYNPIGKGFYLKRFLKPGSRVTAPQIESPRKPVRRIGGSYRPEGFGPIPCHWEYRRPLAGTFDENWKEERWPNLPRDYSPAYNNAAHPDLIYPGFLRGDEEVRLTNLTSEGDLRFRLPGYRAGLLMRFEDGQLVVGEMVLDTCWMDTEARKVHLVWRFPVLKERPLRAVEFRMRTPKGVVRGPRA